MSSTILGRISQLLSELSESQKAVANYILEHYEDSAFMTSTQLAKESGVSESTVIRFAGSLGYERFADMQKDIRGIVRGKLTQIDRLALETRGEPKGSHAKLTQMMRTDMESIEKTIWNVQQEVLDSVVEAISGAGAVFVIGTRSAYGLAHYFGYVLSWIKEHVRLLDGPNSALFDKLSEIAPGDVAIAISTPLYPVHTVELFQLAQKNGATTIAITDSLTSPLAQYSTYCLTVHNEQMTFADNVAPVLSLLTGLLALISGKDPKRSAKALQKMERFWDESGVYYKENS